MPFLKKSLLYTKCKDILLIYCEFIDEKLQKIQCKHSMKYRHIIFYYPIENSTANIAKHGIALPHRGQAGI